MGDERRRHEWPLLRAVEPPSAGWEVAAPGAVVLAIETLPGEKPYDWCKAVALAWCRSPATGAFAVLLAWEDMVATDRGPRVGPRCGWRLFEADRCTAMKATHVPNAWELGWWGGRLDSSMARAIRDAAELLPAHLRERALRPAAPDEVAQLPALR